MFLFWWTSTISLMTVQILHVSHRFGASRKPGNTMLLTPFLLTDALVGKAKPHVLLVDFGLAEIFDEQVGPEFWRWVTFVSACVFFFRCLPLLANCMILLRQILFKQDTILVNQHSCSCKIHLGRTYQSTSQALWKGPLGVPRILEEFDWWKWASYCNQKPLLLGEVAWGQRVEKFNFHRR